MSVIAESKIPLNELSGSWVTVCADFSKIKFLINIDCPIVESGEQKFQILSWHTQDELEALKWDNWGFSIIDSEVWDELFEIPKPLQTI